MKRTIALVAILLLSTAIVPVTVADHSPSHVQVNNQSPRVTFVDGPSSVAPVAGGVRSVNLTIEVFEPNGWRDIQRVEVTVYQSDNETIHRHLNADPVSDGNGPRREYTTQIPMDFWDAPAEPESGYVVEVIATDHPGSVSDPAYHTFAYEGLTAMSLDAEEVQFPATEPGQQSDPVRMGVRNVGNLPLGLEITGSPLVSSGGHEIPASSIRIDHESEAFNNSTALSQESHRLQGFTVEPGPSAWADTWWVLQVPSGETGYVPAGQYSGSIGLTAVEA